MPKVVGDYKILKSLGEGSFSKVKQAVNIKTGKKYAIKIIDRQLVLDNNLEKQLTREIDIMGKMNHPNLIRLHYVMRSPKNIFLVLDLAEGGELFNKLAQDGPLPEDIARSYFQQLIDALSYMHSLKITHRDLKPENLLLDEKGQLKLADFGLSIMSNNSSDLLKTRCGTPNYVAPEIFTSNGYVGPPADIWSAGVILFVMLDASLPFDAPTLPELARQITNVQIRYPRTFSAGAVDLLQHILVADPSQRYTIEQIKNHKWFKTSYKPISVPTEQHVYQQEETTGIVEQSAVPKPEQTMNAFELIAKLSGVNMERMVDDTVPVISSTSFSVNKPKEAIAKDIQEILTPFNAHVHADIPHGVMKAEVPVGAYNRVTIRINLQSVAGNTFLVEVLRLKGSTFDFLRVYRNLKTRLT